MAIEISTIGPNSCHFGAVKELSKRHKATLGFLPEGAFEEYVRQRKIMVAVEEDSLLGYLLHRQSRRESRIVHLCVDPEHRRKGVGRRLVDKLKSSTRHLEGIGLHCRRDFPANGLWPNLGFLPVREQPGRGQQRRTLTFWWFDHGHPDLFSGISAREEDGKVNVVIDANVLYDLREEPDRNTEDSPVLSEPWVEQEVRMLVTPEMLTDINRTKEETLRRERRSFLRQFEVLQSEATQFDESLSKVLLLFPAELSESQASDARHLAHVIASGETTFITRDQALLDMGDAMYEQFGLLILRPVAFASGLDELQREVEYRPYRFAGTTFSVARSQVSQPSEMRDILEFRSPSERKVRFRSIVHELAADAQNSRLSMLRSADGAPHALFGLRSKSPIHLDVVLARFMKGADRSTLARGMIKHFMSEALNSGARVVTVSDRNMHVTMARALEDFGFLQTSGKWIRLLISGIHSLRSLGKELKDLSQLSDVEDRIISVLSSAAGQALTDQDHLQMAAIEKRLWPMKVAEYDLPSFIVPIKPCWALDLFDTHLAEQTLFGADPTLVLNHENAYYRSKSPLVLSAPARVMWYVSSDPRYTETKMIRACSYIDEVAVGTPKDLFRRYRRLGVFSWEDVLGVAKGDLEKEIMAFRFSHTETLRKPIGLTSLRRCLHAQTGKQPQLITAFPISGGCFMELYGRGISQRSA